LGIWRDNVDLYLESKIGKCWRCDYDLTNVKLTGTRRLPELECPRCGLIVELTTRKNRVVSWAFIISATAFCLAFVLGSLL